MPKFLVVNRRLIYGVYSDGAKKYIVDPGEDCPCCTEPEPCDSPCLYDGPLPVQGPFEVWCSDCAPDRIYVKIDGMEADGACTAFPPGRSFKVNGTGNIAGCLGYAGSGLSDDAPVTYFPQINGSTFYVAVLKAPGWRLRWWNNGDCSGAPYSTYENDRVVVGVYFLLLDQTVPANVGKVGVRVIVVSCSNWPIFSSESTYDAAGLQVDPRVKAIPSGSAVVDPCKGFSVNGTAKEIHTYAAGVTMPPAGGFDVFVGGGSATVKLCCDNPSLLPCGPGNAALLRWYKVVKCGFEGDGYVPDVYVPQFIYGPGAVFFIQPGYFCVKVPIDGDYIEQAENPSPVYAFMPQPSCDAPSCTPSDTLEVIDCDSEGVVVGYVAFDDIDDTTKTRVLGALCVTFQPLVGDPDPDLPTFGADDFGSEADDCEHCEGASCPTDNDDCGDSFVGTFTPGGDCTEVTAKAGTLAPLGDGTWEYCQYPDTDPGPGCLTGMKIVCSGKYFIAIVSDTVEEAGYSVQFRKLRTGDCPSTGEWEYVTSSTGCSLVGSTFTLA